MGKLEGGVEGEKEGRLSRATKKNTQREREKTAEEKKESEVTQSCPTLCHPMDCSLPGTSIHGILQARLLEWVAIAFSRGSSQPRDGTRVSYIVGRRFTIWMM